MELAKIRYAAVGLDDLAAIRRFVANTAAAVCDDPDTIAELILALNEAVTNVILHGYGDRSGAIEIVVNAGDRRLSVHLRDQAPAFDPTTAPRPDVTLPLQQRPYGGLGIHMMRQFADSVRYRAIPSGGNELILEKKIAQDIAQEGHAK